MVTCIQDGMIGNEVLLDTSVLWMRELRLERYRFIMSDTGISPELLVEMFRKQYELQCFMHEKRGLCMPPAFNADYISHPHVLAAIYFSSCVNIEWLELEHAYEQYLEAHENGSESEDELRKVALEELIDCMHFILSVFIFLGLKEEYVSKLKHYNLPVLEESLQSYIGSTSLAISAVLSEAPYKTWKDQEEHKVLDRNYNELLFTKISVCYNNVLDFAIHNLDSSYSEFIETYLEKNALNFKRQEDKSLGYVK